MIPSEKPRRRCPMEVIVESAIDAPPIDLDAWSRMAIRTVIELERGEREGRSIGQIPTSTGDAA